MKITLAETVGEKCKKKNYKSLWKYNSRLTREWQVMDINLNLISSM